MTDAKQEDPKHGNQNYDGWDIPRPDSPPRAPRRENPNFPRTKAPPQKHKWIKQSDIKPQPSLSSSDGGITCNSNSNGDPHYDVKKLVDWNGDWIPPPEQWSARKGHTIRNLGSSVEQWIIGHDDICLTTIDTSSVDFIAENGVCKEIVPEYWILPRIEQMSLGEFWKLMPSRQPSALSDVSVHPPFWERYQEGSTLFVHELPMQDARVDPSDPDNHFAGADLMSCTEVRLSLYFGARRRQERKTIVRQNRPVRDCVPTGPPLPDRRIRPKSNVYFRPVQPADVRGIAEIYNHYVDETIFANEFECRTESQIAARIDAIIAAGLPYLVAIARGNQPRGPQHYVSERIVGYAALDDYCDQSSMYRYTFELELYVHPGYLSQNIASCLLDRLLEMADTSYNAHGGYDYKNDSNYLKTGPRRVIKTIMLTVHMEHEVKEKTEDKGKHEGEVAARSNEQIQDKKKTEGKEELQGKAKVDAYMKSFKFFCCGHIPRIGFKLGKEVDAYFYRHVTSEEIDPHGRPTAES
jgi:L-amino acid N-acyltransferase YncA